MRKKAKKQPKKVKRAKRQPTVIITTDDIYRLINRVQVNKKVVTFCLSMDESQIGSNILNDLHLKFRTVQLKKCIRFFVSPSKDVDEVETEIPIDMDETVYLPEE
jgi:hypothetical protein